MTFSSRRILINTTLPQKYVEELEPWDLKELVPFAGEYLSGFRSEKYQIDLKSGFQRAKERMQPEIESSIRRDTGGDKQRIHSISNGYEGTRFKPLLLPVWISSYRFKERVYCFLMNARTGEVQGERPWSQWKIAAAVLAALALAAAIWFYTRS